MLRKEFLQDAFGMLDFLKLIGLRINGSMLQFFSETAAHNILMTTRKLPFYYGYYKSAANADPAFIKLNERKKL